MPYALLGIAALLLLLAPRTAAAGAKPMTDNKRLPLGIRNNNPFNLREGINWDGDQDSAALDADGYEEFETPEKGLRAGFRNLLNQQRLHGLRTVRAILTKYAPASENDTESYIRSVCKKIMVLPDQQLDLVHDTVTLLEFGTAVIFHENGQQPYTYDQLAEAVRQATGAPPT